MYKKKKFSSLYSSSTWYDACVRVWLSLYGKLSLEETKRHMKHDENVIEIENVFFSSYECLG